MCIFPPEKLQQKYGQQFMIADPPKGKVNQYIHDFLFAFLKILLFKILNSAKI